MKFDISLVFGAVSLCVIALWLRQQAHATELAVTDTPAPADRIDLGNLAS